MTSAIRANASLAVWLLLAASASSAAAQAAAPADARGEALPQFRRIVVLPEEIKNRTWTKNFLPIEAAEFERLVQTIAASAAGTPSGKPVLVNKIELSAELSGDDLLVGTGTVELIRQASNSSLLTFEPCTLTLTGATWQDQNAKRASIGTGENGKLQILVEGSRLQFSWSLRGERTASGAISFRFDLPSHPLARLTLDTPSGLEVSADRGIVVKDATTPKKPQRWSVEIGAENQVNLRVTPEGSAQERKPLTLLRQSFTYEFSPRGINLGAQLKLDIHGEPLQRLGINFDPTLRLIAARYGELEVPWSLSSDDQGKTSHVVLQLPEPIAGTGRVLSLTAVAPLTSDTLWRLPTFRVESVAWQEAAATLLIPNSLVLEQFFLDGCRQSRVAALPAPAAGESIDIQYYRPDAAIDVMLAQPRERLKVDRGAQIEIGAHEITSQYAVQFSLGRGQRQIIQAELNPGWTIDGVDYRDSKGSPEWEVEESESKKNHLKIRLQNPVSPNNPARVSIRGRRALPAGPVFEAEQLTMLAYPDLQAGARLVSIRTTDGSDLRVNGEEDLNRLDAQQLSPVDAQLFPAPATGSLFVDNAAFERTTVTVQRRKPSFAAEIRVDVAVQKGLLTETYTLQCVPEAAGVERLLIHFSQARDVPLEWNLAGGTSGLFSARKLSAAEQVQSALPAGGEAWELNLQLSRTGPFELRAIRSSPFAQETPVSLVSIAEASTQRGTLSVRALGDSNLNIKNRRLMSIPAELLEADRYQTVRGMYQYQPARDDLGAEPALSIAPAALVPAESGAWVWNSRLESRYAVDDVAVHWCTLFVQTAGQQQVRVSLPKEAQLQGAWLDQRRLVRTEKSPDQDGLLIDLPAGRSFATILLCYATAGCLPDVTASTAPPFPDVDVAVMTREWSVWLPPGYAIRDVDDRLARDSIVAPTWSQRLFGVLGRGRGARIFNPFVAHDWRQLVGIGSDRQLSQAVSEQFIRKLDEVLADYVHGEELTWGQLLALSTEAETQSHRTLLIDALGLQSAGIGPQTRIPSFDANSARAIALLKEARLALIAVPNAVVLTSCSTAAAYTSQLSIPAAGVLYTLSPGPLADELQHAAQSGSRFVPVDVWRDLPEQGLSPWPPIDPARPSVADLRGWNNYVWQFSTASAPRIRVVRSAAMQSLSWALFLGLVALGMWKAPYRAAALVAVIALALACSLLVPTSYLPLTTAASLAGLFCLSLQLMRIAPPAAERHSTSRGSSKPRSSVARPVAMILAVAALGNLVVALHAAQPDASRGATSTPTDSADKQLPAASAPKAAVPAVTPPPAAAKSSAPRVQPTAAPIYEVFVVNGSESGRAPEKYFVPEELYSQLYRRSGIASGLPAGWLVTGASYQGSLARDPANKRLGLSQLKVTFDIRVFQSNLPVRFAFPREGAQDLVRTARIDGREIPIRWGAAGDTLELGALTAGQYRLELDLKPSLQADLGSAGFDLPIPPVANAQLELTFPRDAPAIELPTARGQIRVAKENGELSAQLGFANRLSARWPLGLGSEGAAQNVEVEELIWVKVRPGTTILDAKFEYHALSGRINRIRLLADPRLRLLPTTSSTSPITAVHAIPGDPQRIDLEIARTATEQVSIELSFLLTETSSIGNLRLPRLESGGARASKRWLAVSVDAALQSKEQPGEDCKPLDVAEFVAAWGPADARPQTAYVIPRGTPLWLLATQPNEAQLSVEQTLALSLGRSSALFDFNASLLITGGYLFQLSVQGPPGLAVDNVSVLANGTQSMARWSADEAGRITVFLTAPVNGRQQFSLQGHRDAHDFEVPPMAPLQILGAELKKNQLQLYRQPAVLAEIQEAIPLADPEATLGEARRDVGSLIGTYTIADPQALLHFKLAPNAPKSRATCVTYLQRDTDRWVADFEYYLEVREGLVDTLRFDIPPQWSEPFRVEPPLPFTIISIPGEQRRQLVVRPLKPIGGAFSLKIRGRVAPFADRLRVPEILPLRVDLLERFVVLPQYLDLQPINWDTQGLSRAALPTQVAPRGASAPSVVTYQVAGQKFQASLMAVERVGATARVKLVDVQQIWHADGNCSGLTTFDVESGGANYCVLELPAGASLLHVAVDSLPAQTSEVSPGRWRLALGAQQLPCCIEVVHTGPLASDFVNRPIPCPHLVDLQVDRALWTIHAPPQFRLAEVNPSDGDATASRQDLARLESIIALTKLPADVVAEHLPEEIARWYRPWRNRYLVSRGALDGQLGVDRKNLARTNESAETRQLDQQIGTIDAQFGLAEFASRPFPSGESSTKRIFERDARTVPWRFSLHGKSTELAVRYSRLRSDSLASRWGVALGVLALGLAGGFWLRSRPLPKFAPWSVVAGVSLLWWLFLAPSVIGLFGLVVACWAAIRPRWQPPTPARR